MIKPWTTRFFELALEVEALRFGRFTLKSGRESPYFFNAGEFSTGSAIAGLAGCYTEAIMASGLDFDMLYGPAYKGIPLVTAVAISLSRDHGLDLPFAYNRKEAKQHGEGGSVVGATLAGRVLIVDDVISAGTSVNESIAQIRAAGAEPAGLAIALDRQERSGDDERSAIQAVQASGLSVIAIAGFDDLITWLSAHDRPPVSLEDISNYQKRYGMKV